MNKIKPLRMVFITLLIVIFATSNLLYINAKEPIVFDIKASVEENSVVYIVDITENSNVCGLSLEVLYDENQVKLEECVVGTIIDNGMTKSNTKINGKVILTYISTEPLKSKGSLLELKFSIISSDASKLNIASVISECIDKSCDDLTFSVKKDDIINPNYKEDNTSSNNNSNTDNPNTSSNQSSNNSNQSNISSNQTVSADSDNNSTNNNTQENPSSNSTTSSQSINKAPPDIKHNNLTVFIVFIISVCVIILAWILYKKCYRGSKK